MDAFWTGAMDKLAERAHRSGAVAVSLVDRSGRRVAPDKPAAKKPSRRLGLGEETMDMGEMKMKQPALQQPAKPARY